MEKVRTDRNREEPCAVTHALKTIGGKWKLIILWRLSHRTYRFGELSRSIPGITQKMLTQQLREMEQDGLVSRRIYPEIPPKVEYSVTETGRSLRDVLESLSAWGERQLAR
jgi:DNA-binding HxlR family transcriptional regulator